MTTLLQFDFPFDGPFGEEMTTAFQDLARDIAAEDGLIWKVWIENEPERRAGGIYLFAEASSAARYQAKHQARLESFGVTGIVARSFSVNGPLSAITRAPL